MVRKRGFFGFGGVYIYISYIIIKIFMYSKYYEMLLVLLSFLGGDYEIKNYGKLQAGRPYSRRLFTP